MVDLIKDEYRKRKLNFYKKLLIATAEAVESHSLVHKRVIDRTNFFAGVKSFCEKIHIEDYYDEFVQALENFWKVNKVEVKDGPKKRLISYLYYIALVTNRWAFSDRNAGEIYDFNLLKNLDDFFSEESNAIFVDFVNLRLLVDDMPLNRNDKSDLMLEVIRLNDSRFKSGSYSVPVNKDAILEDEQKRFLTPLLKDLAKFNVVDCFDDLNLPFYKKLNKKVKKIKEENPFDVSLIESACDAITSLVFNADVLDDDVKEKLESALEQLSCSYVYKTLASREAKAVRQQAIADEKREKQEEVQVQEIPVVPKKKMLSKKETNKILRKVKAVYDFDTAECKKILTMDEIISVVASLMRINANSETIETFIYSAEKMLRQNPIAAYYELLDKIKSTVTSDILLSYIDEIELLISELYKNAADEEKCINIIDNINEYIKLFNYSLGEDYSYELEKARKLVEDKHEKTSTNGL